jgi:16S rRNA (adenine1518-N6/adenine1519-N6)-dimethyltransferase
VVLDVKLPSELVQVAFSQRRKPLRHYTLGQWLQHAASLASSMQRRAQEVSAVGEYVAYTAGDGW